MPDTRGKRARDESKLSSVPLPSAPGAVKNDIMRGFLNDPNAPKKRGRPRKTVKVTDGEGGDGGDGGVGGEDGGGVGGHGEGEGGSPIVEVDQRQAPILVFHRAEMKPVSPHRAPILQRLGLTAANILHQSGEGSQLRQL